MLVIHSDEVCSVQVREWNHLDTIEVFHVAHTSVKFVVLQKVAKAPCSSLRDLIPRNTTSQESRNSKDVISFTIGKLELLLFTCLVI